jgi:hypothetical protein
MFVANSCDGLVIDQSARLPTHPRQRRDTRGERWAADLLAKQAVAYADALIEAS